MVGLIREMIENERHQASKDRKMEFQLEIERKQVPKGRKMKEKQEHGRKCKKNALDIVKIHTLILLHFLNLGRPASPDFINSILRNCMY